MSDPVMSVYFEVPGEPHGKARPSPFIDKKTGRMRQAPQKHAKAWKNSIIAAFLDAVFKAGRKRDVLKAWEGPVGVQVIAYFSIPKSKPKWWRDIAEAGMMRCTKKPDYDNIAKLVCDSLNKVGWQDDSQCFGNGTPKYYGKRPCVIVRLDYYEEAKKPC